MEKCFTLLILILAIAPANSFAQRDSVNWQAFQLEGSRFKSLMGAVVPKKKIWPYLVGGGAAAGLGTYLLTRDGGDGPAPLPILIARDDQASAVCGSSASINVLANDTGEGFAVTAVSPPAGAAVAIGSGGTILISDIGSQSFSFTYTVTDRAGQTATATVNVTVALPPIAANDDAFEAPASMNIQGNVLANDEGTGIRLTANTEPANGSLSISPEGLFTFMPDPGFCGNTEFAYTITDACGQSVSALARLTIIDDQATTITCPLNIALLCSASVEPEMTGFATAQDNCSSPDQITITYTDQLTDFGILRTWTATDQAGNASTCEQQIVIFDVQPTITCPADIELPCGTSTEPEATGFATAEDDCSLPDQIAIAYTDQFTDLGILRIWTATDQAGNASICVQLITFIDEQAPTITCPADIELPCGTSTEPEATGFATAQDDCSLPDQLIITYTDQLTDLGILRTWTATDQAGNASSCQQLITFIDADPPTIACPPNINQFPCSISPTPNNTGFPTVSDNCSPPNQITTTFSDQASGPGCVEALTRMWTAIDAAGNASSCVQSITIVDLAPPAISCPLDASVSCGEEFDPTITGVPEAFDDCSPSISLDFSDDLSGYANCEGLIIRTWIATDGCGNASSCQQQVAVAPIPCEITASLSLTPSPCGAAEGSISVEISPPGTYTVMWSNGLAGTAITGLSAGFYEATITAAGTSCVLVVAAEVPETPAYFLDLVEFAPPSSPDASDGAVMLVVNPPSVILPMVVLVNGVFYGLENSPIFTVFGLTAGVHTFMIIENEGNGCASTELTVELIPEADKPQGNWQWFPFSPLHRLPSSQLIWSDLPLPLPQLPEHPQLEVVGPAIHYVRGMPAGISMGTMLSSRLQITWQLQQYQGEAVHTLRAVGAPQAVPFALHQSFVGWDGRLGLRLFSRPEATGLYLGLEGQWQRLAYGAAFLAGSPRSVPLIAERTEDIWGLGMTAGLRLPAGRQAFLDLNLCLNPFAWWHPHIMEFSPALGLSLPLR